jgi:hypothetical protein
MVVSSLLFFLNSNYTVSENLSTNLFTYGLDDFSFICLEKIPFIAKVNSVKPRTKKTRLSSRKLQFSAYTLCFEQDLSYSMIFNR